MTHPEHVVVKKRRRDRRGWVVAVLATLAAGAAVAWTAKDHLLHGRDLPYAPLVLLEGMTVVGLVWSAFYARWLYLAQQDTLAAQQEALATDRATLATTGRP